MTRLTKIGKVKIIDNKYILKEEKDLTDIYNFLLSRDFKNIPNLVCKEERFNKYEYIEDYNLNDNQKGEEIIDILSELHNKTSYTKEVSKDDYDKIVDNLSGYINYLDEYYYNILIDYESVVYPSPHQLLFLTNYSKLKELLEFLKKEINNYQSLVESKNKVRVSLIHNNMETSHLRNHTLISWDNAYFDTPIIDIVKFYKKEWNNLDFSTLLEKYLNKTKLLEEEKKLLFINLCIPDTLTINNNEFINTENTTIFFDYIYKIEELIRPYYTIENKE